MVYAQLILENAKIYEVPDDLLDQNFDFMVLDMSKHALSLSLQARSSEEQAESCKKMFRKAIDDPNRYLRVWENHVVPLDGAYEMKR